MLLEVCGRLPNSQWNLTVWELPAHMVLLQPNGENCRICLELKGLMSIQPLKRVFSVYGIGARIILVRYGPKSPQLDYRRSTKPTASGKARSGEIGRASCRESAYGSGVGVAAPDSDQQPV